MFCPRIRHFIRLNQNGTIGKCGHMVTHMGIQTFDELDKSDWLAEVEQTMAKDQWPKECMRCQHTEKVKGESVRTKSIERHKETCEKVEYQIQRTIHEKQSTNRFR